MKSPLSGSNGPSDPGARHARECAWARTGDVMSPFRTIAMLAVGILSAAWVAPAQAGAPLVIETVTIGNPGNPGEQSRITSSDYNFYGGVAYTFAIGKYEVTAGEYTVFLNAVASTDAHGLYDTRMDYDADATRNGCNIKRDGSPGSYTYSVAPDWANRPVNYVSWADAVRFVNWLHNGQPTGVQDATTTEDGSYFLNGIHESNDGQLENVTRKPGATWVIPTEDEWYKAAYHKNDGATASYWHYPTSADNGVSNALIDPDPGNHATFTAGFVGNWTIGAPYYRTEVGAHENSASAYGAFDMGGNVQEFNETVPESDIRGIRGGSWYWGSALMSVWEREMFMHSSDQFRDLGFRVGSVAVPSTSVPPRGSTGLRFTIAGPRPVHDEARFLVGLPEAARVRIDVFDLAGRRIPSGVELSLPAGTSEVRWGTDALAPGIYLARLGALGRSEVVRFVRIR